MFFLKTPFLNEILSHVYDLLIHREHTFRLRVRSYSCQYNLSASYTCHVNTIENCVLGITGARVNVLEKVTAPLPGGDLN